MSEEVCDICSQATQREQGFVLTTREVVTSQAYWGQQLGKYAPALTLIEQRMARADFLVEQARKLIASPTGWLVCTDCIGIFQFDEQAAKDSALSRQDRLTSGPVKWGEVMNIIYPVIETLVGPREAASGRSSNKRFYQCPECGTILHKDPAALMAAGSGVNVSGGNTCADCGTRVESADVYRGRYDFDCADQLIEQMINDSDNAIPNIEDKTWTYQGRTIVGPASAVPAKKWWEFWR